MLLFRSKIVLNEVWTNAVLAENGKKIGRTGPGPRFCILLRAGSGLGRNFVFSFGPSWAWDKIFMFTLDWAGPGRDCNLCGPGLGLKNPVSADL